MREPLTPLQNIERTINKQYKSKLWAPFLTAIIQYELIQDNDKIAVCISGGKDSMLMAKLFQLLQRYSDQPFELVFLTMDPGYDEVNRKRIEDNAKILGLPLTIFETNIYDIAFHEEKSPCYLCARMRRGHLYNKAKELGCNKIALGHHLNDAIETTVMAMFYSSKLETIVPKAKSENFEGMELIRPMYRIKEEDIKAWAATNNLEFIQCACRFSENCTLDDDDTNSSKRKETKKLIRTLKEKNPAIEDHIFQALHAVRLDSFPGYKSKDEYYTFLDNYDKEKD